MAEITEQQLLTSFVQGAKWWEYHQTKFTMWQSDQQLAYKAAEEKLAAGSLGKSVAEHLFPNECVCGRPKTNNICGVCGGGE